MKKENDRTQEEREEIQGNGRGAARRAERLAHLNKESTVVRGVAGSVDY